MKQSKTLTTMCSLALAAGLIAIGCTGSGLQAPTGGINPSVDTAQGQADGSQGLADGGNPTGSDSGGAGGGQDAVTPDGSSLQDTVSPTDGGALTDAGELTDGSTPEGDAVAGPLRCPL
jgi:hypothetical protein